MKVILMADDQWQPSSVGASPRAPHQSAQTP